MQGGRQEGFFACHHPLFLSICQRTSSRGPAEAAALTYGETRTFRDKSKMSPHRSIRNRKYQPLVCI